MADPTFTDEELAAGDKLFEQPWRFIKGVVDFEAIPFADRPEIAFAGRSNVGKSSLINAVVRQNGLARTSNTPGRTQEINYFEPQSQDLFLVDLPGYGFAKAPKGKVQQWTKFVKGYLAGRPNLSRVFLLIDARHGIKSVDRGLMSLLSETAVSYQVVLTKADKISVAALTTVVAETQALVAKEPAAFPFVLVTSSEKTRGIREVRATIAQVQRDHR
jgi:GTP-binding protein